MAGLVVVRDTGVNDMINLGRCHLLISRVTQRCLPPNDEKEANAWVRMETAGFWGSCGLSCFLVIM